MEQLSENYGDGRKRHKVDTIGEDKRVGKETDERFERQVLIWYR